MTSEHIGRKQSIGLGPETVSGTSVAATAWVPKIDGSFTPENTTAEDQGAYGIIDELRDQQTVKTITTVDFSADARDVYVGHVLKALFGTEYPCTKVPIPGSITGTFVEGETVTETTSAAKGVLRRADVSGSSKVLYIDNPSIGTFTVTIATPGVFSLTSHGLVAGDSVYFTTTGALPTGLSVNTNYFVIAGGLTTNAFEVSATSGGSAINTSGSQSGVHTCWRGKLSGGLLLTGATSGATATGGTVESAFTLRHHVYRLLNSNTHPSYTIYGSDPVGDSKSVYCMLDSFDIEIASGKYATFKAKFMGKKVQSASAQTPSFTAQNGFLSKYANFYAACAVSGLDGSTPVVIKTMKLSFKKNLTDFQQWGATDVTGFFNRQFTVSGEFTLLYNANTFRDYVTASTTQAFRVTLANTDVTIGSAANPTLQFDFPLCSFKKWSRTNNNNDLVEQTLMFNAAFDVSSSMTAQALLVNTQTTAF